MMYIKVNTQAIDEINNQSLYNKLQPIKTINGDWVLKTDILTDEQTWGHAIPYLSACEQLELTEDDFPKPKMN